MHFFSYRSSIIYYLLLFPVLFQISHPSLFPWTYWVELKFIPDFSIICITYDTIYHRRCCFSSVLATFSSPLLCLGICWMSAILYQHNKDKLMPRVMLFFSMDELIFSLHNARGTNKSREPYFFQIMQGFKEVFTTEMIGLFLVHSHPQGTHVQSSNLWSWSRSHHLGRPWSPIF